MAVNLPIIIRQQLARRPVPGGAWVGRFARLLASEIELLAPAVRRGGRRPDNCEYPWADDAGCIRVPSDWSFPTTRLIRTPAGRTIVKLIQSAIHGMASG